MSLGVRERTLETRLDNARKLMMSQVVKGTWLPTGALWRLKGVQKVRSISFNLAVTLPVVDNAFDQSGQDK